MGRSDRVISRTVLWVIFLVGFGFAIHTVIGFWIKNVHLQEENAELKKILDISGSERMALVKGNQKTYEEIMKRDLEIRWLKEERDGLSEENDYLTNLAEVHKKINASMMEKIIKLDSQVRVLVYFITQYFYPQRFPVDLSGKGGWI